MKAFEFTLQRTLEFYRQQADSERITFQKLVAQLKTYEDEQTSLRTQDDEARVGVTGLPSIDGQHLLVLAAFRDHVERRSKDIEHLKVGLLPQVERQRLILIGSDRKVKLLERLREQKFREWLVRRDKEIDELAADSHLARLSAARRPSQSRRDLAPLTAPLASSAES